ncbi:hypothetical protein [Variovorax boronicumulans]|uniref:hypothetical protein n=1 Tax=Variovorax boronicumulans TaxID=436515 RepID=UPI00339925BF
MTMTKFDARLLDPDLLPDYLWNKNTDRLTLPEPLAIAYVNLVDQKNLRELSANRDKGPVGGLTQESADEHFAQAFDGSAARAMLAVLDPKNEIGSTSNNFIRSTAGAALALTDAPCGAGAATLSFLTTIAELRKASVLPRVPLKVHLIAGEFSNYAVNHAKDMFASVLDFLEEQAITVELNFVSWDVTDPVSTTTLIKNCVIKGSVAPAKLLVVANFNGFLVREKRQKDARPQLDELFRYASGEKSFAIWIEPDMNRATGNGGFFSFLLSFFNNTLSKFGIVDANKNADGPAFRSSAKFSLPLQPGNFAAVRLAVMPIDLTKNSL